MPKAKKKPKRRRDQQFNLRLTSEERELLDEAAAAEDLEVGTFMRRAALKAARRVLGALKAARDRRKI